MKIKTSTLEGISLDYAVAVCEGQDVVVETSADRAENFWLSYVGIADVDEHCIIQSVCADMEPMLRVRGSYGVHLVRVHKYSTDWEHSGPIIERERISVATKLSSSWFAERYGDHRQYTGPTPLIAVMRCYVAKKLGDEIEIPDTLR